MGKEGSKDPKNNEKNDAEDTLVKALQSVMTPFLDGQKELNSKLDSLLKNTTKEDADLDKKTDPMELLARELMSEKIDAKEVEKLDAQELITFNKFSKIYKPRTIGRHPDTLGKEDNKNEEREDSEIEFEFLPETLPELTGGRA